MNVVLVGHTVGIRYCIEALKTGPHKIHAIFTHARNLHENDLRIFEKRKEHFGDFAYDVFDSKVQFGIPVYEYDNLSSSSSISRIKEHVPDVIVTVGCRDIVTRKFIDSFHHVINLHPFNLPFFRGAGIDSWMILQGYDGTEQSTTCHFINEKIDAGNIICTLPYFIPPGSLPLDIFKIRIAKLGLLLVEALSQLEKGFTGVPQDKSKSRYFPRLNTGRDGRLNFRDYTGPELERFIRAFSYPYDGAYFLYEGIKIHCLHAKFFEERNVHPFSFGLIIRKSENELMVFCRQGYLLLSQFETSSSFTFSDFKTGKFLQ